MSKSIEKFDSQKRYFYITDWYNYRVVRFSDLIGSDWEEIALLQGWGIIDGPTGIAIDKEGRFLIVDRGRSTILRLDSFSSQSSFETFQNHVLYRPQRVIFDSSNRMYITGGGADNLVRIDDFSGTNLVELPLRGHPTGIALDSKERIYVCLYKQDKIVRMDDITGKNMVSFGIHGTGINQLHYPADLILDSEDRIYITDKFNNRIVRIDDMNGKGWKEFDIRVLGNVTAPNVLTFSEDGKLLFTCLESFVQMDNLNGDNPILFGIKGHGKFNFRQPIDICLT